MFSQPTHGFYVPLFTIFYSSLASLPFYSNLTTFFSSSSALSSPLSKEFYFFLLIFLLHLFSLCFFVRILFLFFSSFPSLLLPIDFSSFFRRLLLYTTSPILSSSPSRKASYLHMPSPLTHSIHFMLALIAHSW